MRKRLDRRMVPLLLAVVVVVGVVAASAMAASSHPTVKVMKTASLGKLLATSSGLTLYHYTDEKPGKIDCKGGCAKLWPPLLVKAGAKPTVGPGLSAAKLGTIKRPDGGTQVTYNGYALYRYAPDKKAGDVKGQGALQGVVRHRADRKAREAGSGGLGTDPASGRHDADGHDADRRRVRLRLEVDRRGPDPGLRRCAGRARHLRRIPEGGMRCGSDEIGMAVMEPGSLVMERKMLLGIEKRAERMAAHPDVAVSHLTAAVALGVRPGSDTSRTAGGTATIASPAGIPEWPKGAGCKPAGSAFGGSNPPPCTGRTGQPSRRIAVDSSPSASGPISWCSRSAAARSSTGNGTSSSAPRRTRPSGGGTSFSSRTRSGRAKSRPARAVRRRVPPSRARQPGGSTPSTGPHRRRGRVRERGVRGEPRHGADGDLAPSTEPRRGR